jgi:sugar/nucleoside kinase (ribokinase family)
MGDGAEDVGGYELSMPVSTSVAGASTLLACGAGVDDPGSAPHRVHVIGAVCLDLVFAGLAIAPQPGTEVRATSLGLSPGGVANIAVALARLGSDVSLSGVFACDAFGQYLWSSLDHEGIDLRSSVRLTDWATPVTTSIAFSRERSMVTYEEHPPVAASNLPPPSGRSDAVVVSLGDADVELLERLHRHARLVVADVAWDPDARLTEELRRKLSLVDIFLPNAREARTVAECDDIAVAARSLACESGLVVVKDGASGALAWDASTGTSLRVPGLVVEERDTTGAGDVFDAAFVYASLEGWPLAQRVRFANLCAAESVKHPGGSLAAPCWRDLGVFWEKLDDHALRADYAFLAPLLATCPSHQACTRACPSMSLPVEEVP